MALTREKLEQRLQQLEQQRVALFAQPLISEINAVIASINQLKELIAEYDVKEGA